MYALAPNGALKWVRKVNWFPYAPPGSGPDDTLYFISDGRWVHAFDPHTQTTVWRHDTGIWQGRPTLSPDASIMVTSGGGSQGQLEFVKGFDSATGEELWNVDLQEIYNPNFRHVPIHHPRISADSATAYVSTWTAQWPTHDGDPRATLFAIDTGADPLFCDSFESGDLSAWSDSLP